MNPILVEIYRQGVLESFHRGTFCIVNEKGDIVQSIGDVDQICYPRSAMKFLQVIPLILNGGIEKFGFTLEEIAVMCGSHNAENEHLRVVESILSKIGLTKDALQCGAQYPTSKKEANTLIQLGTKPNHIHNNCSGKHAGMLAACKLLGFSTNDYINPNHPLQQLILDISSLMYEYPKEKMITALDGCSAPIFSVPIYNQALAYKNLVSKRLDISIQNACSIVLKAVSTYPMMVAGTGRYCSDMMNITAPKVIGKTGAEGIFCMTFTEQQMGICIKIDDGKMNPQYNIAEAILESSGLFSSEQLHPLHHYALNDITNFNKLKTGEVKVNTAILKQLEGWLTDYS